MSNYTVETLNKYRDELKSLILNIANNFSNVSSVTFLLRGLHSGIFEPTYSLKFDITGIPGMGHCDQLPTSFEVGVSLQMDSIQQQSALINMPQLQPIPMNNLYGAPGNLGNPGMLRGGQVRHLPQEVSAPIYKFRTNHDGMEMPPIDKLIDAIFIGVVARLLPPVGYAIAKDKIKGYTLTQGNDRVDIKVKNGDEVLFSHELVHGGFDTLPSVLMGIATALVLIPENHGIIFKERQEPVFYGQERSML